MDRLDAARGRAATTPLLASPLRGERDDGGRTSAKAAPICLLRRADRAGNSAACAVTQRGDTRFCGRNQPGRVPSLVWKGNLRKRRSSVGSPRGNAPSVAPKLPFPPWQG